MPYQTLQHFMANVSVCYCDSHATVLAPSRVEPQNRSDVSRCTLTAKHKPSQSSLLPSSEAPLPTGQFSSGEDWGRSALGTGRVSWPVQPLSCFCDLFDVKRLNGELAPEKQQKRSIWVEK